MNMRSSPELHGGDEPELWARLRENAPDVRERLFLTYAPLANQLAKRHAATAAVAGAEFGDVRQLAFAGLLEAMDGYRPELGAPFSAYARHRIGGAIRDGISRASERSEQISWQRRMTRERSRSLAASDTGLARASGPLDALAEIAVGLAIGFMLEETGMYVDEGAAVAPLAAAYESMVWKELVGHLSGQLSTLPEREQTILRQHYLHGVSFDQLAAALRISKGRVSQMHRVALGVLKKRMADRGYFRLER